jgi:hypothetical protein
MSDIWPIVKQEFQQRFNTLTATESQIRADVDLLNNSTGKYIASGGVSQNPAGDANYADAKSAAGRIASYKDKLADLVSEVNERIKDISIRTDIGAKLTENGQLQQEIVSLEKEAKDYDQDVKTAELRESLLRSRESDITRHQVYLLGRPLRPSTVPYLWALSILFIGAGLLIFQQLMPPIPPLFGLGGGANSAGGLLGFLSDIRIWSTLVGALLIVILFLSLRIANVI